MESLVSEKTHLPWEDVDERVVHSLAAAREGSDILSSTFLQQFVRQLRSQETPVMPRDKFRFTVAVGTSNIESKFGL